MVELRRIDKDNYIECLNLQVSEGQRNFVASNVYSLAQAWVYSQTAYPFAIYADGTMVGFVMMGFYEVKQVYTIWRLMIDARYQGKGYGKTALQLSIDYLRQEHHVNQIYLSFEPDNTVAEKLYSSFGFQRTGEVAGGEIEMRLEIMKEGGICANPTR